MFVLQKEHQYVALPVWPPKLVPVAFGEKIFTQQYPESNPKNILKNILKLIKKIQ